MTPAELRQAATELLDDCDCGQNGRIVAQYVLDTVREDDGEEIDDAFLKSVIAPLGRIAYRKGRRVIIYEFQYQDVVIRSRGQLRRLLEGLGVACA